jgi:hypothetical protein
MPRYYIGLWLIEILNTRSGHNYTDTITFNAQADTRVYPAKSFSCEPKQRAEAAGLLSGAYHFGDGGDSVA